MASEHWLTPMLAPGSIALVGGSPRRNTVGNMMVHALREGGYPGELYVVNPRYDEVEGLSCVPAIRDLERPPDLAILSVAAPRMEQVMIDAIAAGARSAVVFDPCFFQGDTDPPLLDRLRAIAAEASFPVCGGNGMGFHNYDTQTFASFAGPRSTTQGHIAAFCHSGSVFGYLARFDARHRFNLITSQGQEIGATVADFMDYALEQPSTRAIALFLETVRDPEGFVQALEKARSKAIPVVIDKVGRTEESARLAATHTGAIASSATAFDAICEHYGVLRADDLDELMASAQILAHEHEVGPGGFAAVLDSGGLREQLIDLADDLGVGFAPLAPSTVERLRARLPHGLEAVNPLDAAGPMDEDHGPLIVDCMHMLADDPGCAIIAHEIYGDDVGFSFPEVVEAARAMPKRTAKPYVVLNSFAVIGNARIASELMDCGVPLVNGAVPLLVGARNALAYRDFLARPGSTPPGIDTAVLQRIRTRLSSDAPLDESTALEILGQAGVPVVGSRICSTRESAISTAAELGFPVALKTAGRDANHKSDVDGVRLGLMDAAAVASAYDDLSARLGRRVSVATMAPEGVEIGFGMVNDPQFGPIVMVGAGGTLVELLDDRVFAIPPFDEAQAQRLVRRLKIGGLLAGFRGAAPADIDSLCTALSRFSVMVGALHTELSEVDVNPVIVSPEGCLAVDALVVPQDPQGENGE